ncbi:MAG: SAM-dependent methyltransferase [Oscillospiraceae bacterium]|nr:SAM-dependent methyltransferase [Oscillospiraceae bacterium]
MANGLALQPRLRAIADLVPDGARLVDVGTDHGFIPVDLLLSERIRCAIASDIGAAPLDHARRTAEQYEVTEGIEFRLCDGLRDVSSNEVDCIVIAGMGGDNIASILDAAPWTKEGKFLLLQPMSKAEVLRRWLSENGYLAVAERLVADKGVIYPILSVRGGEMQLFDEAQFWGGFLLDNDPLQERYLDERILRLRRAAMGLEKAKDPAVQQRRGELCSIISALELKKGGISHADSMGN